MRLRHVKNACEIIAQAKNICYINPISEKGVWKKHFPNSSKIILEVGMGKGQFLTSIAQNNPDNLYLGMEKMDSVICRAITKVEEKELSNCILILGDAEKLLDYFNEKEIDEIYLSFPDPWPKARHEKRRLTSPNFLVKYRTILKEDGIIYLKTDNASLFEYSLSTMSPLLKNYEKGEIDYQTPKITTEFEDKFRLLKEPIYYLKGQFKEAE